MKAGCLTVSSTIKKAINARTVITKSHKINTVPQPRSDPTDKVNTKATTPTNNSDKPSRSNDLKGPSVALPQGITSKERRVNARPIATLKINMYLQLISIFISITLILINT